MIASSSRSPRSSTSKRSDGRRLSFTGAILLVALLAGVNALAYYLYREARALVTGGLHARITAIGRAAVTALAEPALREPAALRRYLADLRRQSALENVFVFDPELRSLADARAAIPAGQRYDRLQLDAAAARAARAGGERIAEQYDVEGLEFLGAYFAVPAVAPGAVLYLESPVEYLRPLGELRAALFATLGISLALVGLLGTAAWLSERALARAREQAARAQRLAALGEMAARVAHEVRNPLAIIRGSAELLAEDDGGAKRAAVILDEVARLDRLIGDFLSLAREAPLSRAPFDLAALVRETAERFALTRDGAPLRVDAPPRLPVSGDELRLRQVLVNLLRNACEACPRGEVAVSLRAENGAALLVVRDQGPGVPAELRDRLFEPFFTTKEGGAGLGLVVSRQILERHGGSLRLRSPRGGGAELQAMIPLG